MQNGVFINQFPRIQQRGQFFIPLPVQSSLISLVSAVLTTRILTVYLPATKSSLSYPLRFYDPLLVFTVSNEPV